MGSRREGGGVGGEGEGLTLPETSAELCPSEVCVCKRERHMVMSMYIYIYITVHHSVCVCVFIHIVT